MSQFVKQEDVNKYRCKVPDCTKLFKGVEFWRKHVEKRHEDFHTIIRTDVSLVNTYVLDPAHIAPSRSDANSNGHFPLNNHVPTGTPRGFQLNQQFPMGFPMGAGMPQPMGGGPGMPGMWTPTGQAVPMPAGWGQGMPAYAAGAGPMRNMGRNAMPVGGAGMNGFGGARMPGPYARMDGRGRMPSMSGARPGMGGGPMMGMGMGRMEGGAGAMGPVESVQGRQMRSYEDLDADKGEGTGELNY